MGNTMKHAERQWKTWATSAITMMTVLASVGWLLTSCSHKAASQWLFEARARPLIATPSLDPQLATIPSGVVLATAIVPNGKGRNDLFFYTSADGGDVFRRMLSLSSANGDVHPHREGTPRLLIGGSGQYYALWTGTGIRGDGMDLYLVRSDDYGHSFSSAIPLDAQAGGSHPYFNAAAAKNGTLVVIWISYDTISGAVPGTGTLQLMRSSDGGLSFSPPKRLATDVCPCCRPELKTDEQGNWYLAWRQVDPDQSRNIVLASSHDDGVIWSDPVYVSRDEWRIDGCPDSGPTLALLNGDIFIAWYTVVNDRQRLYWSRSQDKGRNFAPRSDLAEPVRDPNHPYLIRIGNHLLATFQGRDPRLNQGWSNQQVYVRQIAPTLSAAPIALAHGSGSGSYPIGVALGADEVMIAWTDSSVAGDRILSVRGYLKQGR